MSTPLQTTAPELLARPVRVRCSGCGRDLAADLVRRETNEGPACWPKCGKPARDESRAQGALW